MGTILAFITANRWYIVAAIVAGAVLGGSATHGVTSWIYDGRIDTLNSDHIKALEKKDQEKETMRLTLLAEFNKQKAQTDALNQQSTARISDLERRVADAKRVRQGPASCTPIIVRTPAAGSSNTGSVPAGYVYDGHGITTDRLIDYYALAEKIRNSQDICRQQLDQIYGANSPKPSTK